MGGGGQRFRRNFCLTRPNRIFRKVIHLCFNEYENSGYRKFFRHNRGCHDFPSKISCLSTGKLRWRALRCFRKFRVWRIFAHKKGISVVSVEIFCFTVPIIFVGKHFCVSKSSGINFFHA